MRTFLSNGDGLAKRWGMLLLIAALAIAAYGGTVRNGFVWDDETFIVNNSYVHDLSRLPEYFTEARSITAAPDPGLLRMYRPLQTVSYALDDALWKGWGGGFHITSLVLHIAACFGIIFAFGPLVGRRASFFAAVLFAVHPALSEGALSLASRGNQLYTLLALLSVGWFVRSRRSFDGCHLLSAAAALGSFFSKEQAIVLIVLLPLLQVQFGRPWRLRERSSILLHLPYLIGAAVFLAARQLVVDTSWARPYWGGSLGKTLLMQSQVFVTYMRLLVWPFRLVGRYPVPYSDPFVVLHVLLNVAAVALAIVLWRRGGKGRLVALAIAWFYVSLAPVANLIPVPGNMTGERFLYFTYAGMFPLLIAALPDSLAERHRKPAFVVALCLLAVFVVKDIERTPVWRNNARFFAVLAEQDPGEPVVQILAAKEEVLAGNPEPAVRRMAPIINSISTFKPEDKTAAYYWYGRALLDTDRPREAFDQFATITLLLKSVPRDIVPDLVEAAARSGKLAFARSLLLKELEGAPNDDALWNSLGNVLGLMGDRKGSVAAYERALAANPANREAAMNLLNAERRAEKNAR